MLPFKTGQRVTGREFFGRQRELAALREYMASSGRVYLVGERRIGKTSLLFEAARPLRKIPFVYIDLMAVKTVADLTHRFAQALSKARPTQSHLMSLLGSLGSLRPTVTVDPLTQAPTLALAPGTGAHVETLDELFGVLARWPQAVVAFDEFQDILAIRQSTAAIARLRSLVQLQESAAFAFCGSVRNEMEAIFTDPKAPFFNSAVRLFVGPMDHRVLRRMVSAKLAKGQRSIASPLLDQLLETCNHNPGDVQRFCTALWQVTSYGQQITEAHLVEALTTLFAMQREQYEMILHNLSPQQTQALRSLAHIGGESNLSAELLEASGIILLPSLAKALAGLVAKRVVQKIGTNYRFCDPFLAAWLKRQPR